MDKVQIFTQLGLSQPQMQAYLALRQYPNGASVVELSKKLAIARPTLYGHIDTLLKQGLVSPILLEKSKKFIAEPVERIQDLFDERILRLEQSKNQVETLKKSLPSTSFHEPRFSVYETASAAEKILRDILRSREKETYWFWPVEEMLQAIPEDVLGAFHEERIRRGIWLNVLWPENQSDKKRDYHFLKGKPTQKNFLRRARFLPKELKQPIGYGMYGNKVAFLSANSEQYGMIIDSPQLKDALKSQFDYFWKLGKPYKG